MSEIMKTADLIKNIKENLSQASASNKDEVAVMRAMLNDKDFKVTTFTNSGTSEHCPAQEYRSMLSNVVSATAKISKAEAENLVDSYEAKKSDAETMIALSKDFTNTYLRTGRKINLGGTEKSNISIQLKDVPESVKRYPKKVDGGYVKAETKVPAHEGLTVSAPCPDWAR